MNCASLFLNRLLAIPPVFGNQIEITGSGVLGSEVLSSGKRPLFRYWWKTSALGDAEAGSPRPEPLERTTIAWWSGICSGPLLLPRSPKALVVMSLIWLKSGRSLPWDGMGDGTSFRTFTRSFRSLNVFHFESRTYWRARSSKIMRSIRSFGPMAAMNSCATTRASA